jgi:hypothetical protein
MCEFIPSSPAHPSRARSKIVRVKEQKYCQLASNRSKVWSLHVNDCLSTSHRSPSRCRNRTRLIELTELNLTSQSPVKSQASKIFKPIAPSQPMNSSATIISSCWTCRYTTFRFHSRAIVDLMSRPLVLLTKSFVTITLHVLVVKCLRDG